MKFPASRDRRDRRISRVSTARVRSRSDSVRGRNSKAHRARCGTESPRRARDIGARSFPKVRGDFFPGLRPRERFAVIGLPRNDELVRDNRPDRIGELRKKLGIPAGKKVILYAPTFREYAKDARNGCVAKPPLDVRKWERELGSDYVLLFRAHYEVVRVLEVAFGKFARNVSDYPSLNELMLVSDMLISDYSSVFFDYSVLCRPMLCFAYDYEVYREKRGMYFDIRKELRCRDLGNEEALLSEIKKLNYRERSQLARKFKEKYVDVAGTAAKASADIIFQRISES